MKKIISLAICLLMLCTMCISTFAASDASGGSDTEETKQIILKETFTAVKNSRKVETVKKDFLTAEIECWLDHFYLDFRREPVHLYANEGSGAVIDRIDLEVDSVGSYKNDLVIKTADLTALNYHYSLTVNTNKSTSNKNYFHITDINHSDFFIGGDEHTFTCYKMDVYYHIDANKLTDKQLSDALTAVENEYDVARYNMLAEEIESRNAANTTLGSALSGSSLTIVCTVAAAVVFGLAGFLFGRKKKTASGADKE